jgi:hypothetical protein
VKEALAKPVATAQKILEKIHKNLAKLEEKELNSEKKSLIYRQNQQPIRWAKNWSRR